MEQTRIRTFETRDQMIHELGQRRNGAPEGSPRWRILGDLLRELELKPELNTVSINGQLIFMVAS